MPILSCRRGGSQIGRTQHQVSNITTLQTYIWPQQQTDLKIMSDLLLLLLDWLLLSDPFLVLPFGHGPRGCIGRKLAEDSLLLLIIHLFARFRFCQLFYNRSSIIGQLPVNRPYSFASLFMTSLNLWLDFIVWFVLCYLLLWYWVMWAGLAE